MRVGLVERCVPWGSLEPNRLGQLRAGEANVRSEVGGEANVRLEVGGEANVRLEVSGEANVAYK